VQVFIDDIDGVGTTSGLLDSARVDVRKGGVPVTPTPPGDDDTSKRCFKKTFSFPANRVSPGVYDLVVVITLAARTFGGRERSSLGTTQGTIRVSDPLSVEVAGAALPAGDYRLVATVDIFPAGHSPGEPPLHSHGISGDLLHVADAPLGSASAMA
jgi:hypothetical protein